MKALGHVRVYGERAMITFGYGRRHLHFADPQPEVGVILCVEIPEVEHATNDAVIEWLRAQTGQGGSRRELFELPREVWRPAVLDDFVDAECWRYCIWQVSAHFSASELDAFVEKWVPIVREEARTALAEPNEYARALAVKAILERHQRVFAVLQNVPTQLSRQMTETFQRVESARLSALRTTTPPPEEWLEAAEAMETQAVIRDTLVILAEHLRDRGAKRERVEQLLATMFTRRKLRDAVLYHPGFWGALDGLIEYSQNVSGEEIDITDASEATVQASWELWRGRRIGQVVPGRSALVLHDPGGTWTFIRGARKLKFRVLQAGGRLEALGNTFVVREQADAIGAALLEVDRLDTLAQVRPMQALRALEPLDVAPDHPVFEAARAAESDPRHGRVLADLLIELVVGIDADIARGMARAQARANRR